MTWAGFPCSSCGGITAYVPWPCRVNWTPLQRQSPEKCERATFFAGIDSERVRWALPRVDALLPLNSSSLPSSCSLCYCLSLSLTSPGTSILLESHSIIFFFLFVADFSLYRVLVAHLSFCFENKSSIFIYCKVRTSESKGEERRRLFCMLVHFPDNCNSQPFLG